MAPRHALGHVLLHHHALGKGLLGKRLLETALQGLVFEHLLAEIPRGQLVGFGSVLRHVGLRLRERHGRVGAVLLGHLLHQARHRVEHLLARSLHRALQKAVGDEPAPLARDLAFLVAERHAERLGLDHRERRHLLRWVRQDGMVARHVHALRAALAVAHLVHVGLPALQQHEREVALAPGLVGGSGLLVVHRAHRGVGIVLEVEHQEVGRLQTSPCAPARRR